MFCEKCGNKLLDGEKFCSVCGNPVEETEFSQKGQDIMSGMGYGVKQEKPSETERTMPNKTSGNPRPGKNQDNRAKRKKDDLDEEWRKEEKKEKITFIILGVIIVVLVVAIVAGIIFLINSGGSKENERVPRMTEEQVNDLTHGKDEKAETEDDAQEGVAEEITPEVTQEPTPEVTAEPEAETTPEPTKEVTPVPTKEVTPTPTQAPVVVEENNDYIIPDSSTRYLVNADLNTLSEWEIRVARNEIYARHGRMFNSKELAEYFESKSWYTPRIPAEEFDNSYLNGIEVENLRFITDYEKAHNLNQ